MRLVPGLVLLQLTFQDSFDASRIAPHPRADWMTTYPYNPPAQRTFPGNNEAECYMDRSVGEQPFVQAGGIRDISATPVTRTRILATCPTIPGSLLLSTASNSCTDISKFVRKCPPGRGCGRLSGCDRPTMCTVRSWTFSKCWVMLRQACISPHMAKLMVAGSWIHRHLLLTTRRPPTIPTALTGRPRRRHSTSTAYRSPLRRRRKA